MEYTGDGTRGLGRGGAIMTRPDDPYVMIRNPALLADLWGSQLYINTIVGLPGSCSQLTGGWGWGYEGNDSVISMGEGEPPLYSEANEGSQGGALQGERFNLSPSATPYMGEPYPEICYSGGAVLVPSVILSTRLSDALGIGIGFVPPELAQGNQMGGSDGIIETANGKRPNPMRYLDPAYQDGMTFFSFLGAIGYRLLPWLRVGAGFRWTGVMANVEAWSVGGAATDPSLDVRAKLWGHDLFIPGFTTSVHAVPVDSLDLALGFRWDDAVQMNRAKADITASPFSFYSTQDDVFVYEDANGVLSTPEGNIRGATHNVPGVAYGVPITPPQLSFGIRYADRRRPRPDSYSGLQLARDPIRDPMADENWDIEFNAVYYFTSVLDRQVFVTNGIIRSAQQSYTFDMESDDGIELIDGTFPAGVCIEEDSEGECIKAEQSPIELRGKDQISLRLGGDYNIIPNTLATRLGVSYETRGQNPSYVHPSWTMPFERLGIHVGATWRIDGRTDLSIGYAHFFQETIRLSMSEKPGTWFDRAFTYERYEDGTIRNLSKAETDEKYHVVSKDDADGVAQAPIFSHDQYLKTGEPWIYAANAGTHEFSLDVVSISLMRHF